MCQYFEGKCVEEQTELVRGTASGEVTGKTSEWGLKKSFPFTNTSIHLSF